MNTKEKNFWCEFLELYESMPPLWRIKSADYSNRDMKSKCYEKMVAKLKEIDPEASREKVIKKINTFRTNYKRDLKKVKMSEKSGAGTEDLFESSLWYFHKLKFLEDQECTREGKCTMNTEDINVVSSEDSLETPPPKKKRKVSAEDDLLKLACQKLASSNDANFDLAKGWATQYEELPEQTQEYNRFTDKRNPQVFTNQHVTTEIIPQCAVAEYFTNFVEE